MRLGLLLIAALALSGCRCGRRTEGSCSGKWGELTLEQALLDKTSRMVIVKRTACTDTDLKLYELSWGAGQLTSTFSFKGGGPTVLGTSSYTLPPASFISFTVTPNPRPPTGTLELGIEGLAGDRTGTLVLRNGGDEMTCTFKVSYETEGNSPRCGGSGGDSD